MKSIRVTDFLNKEEIEAIKDGDESSAHVQNLRSRIYIPKHNQKVTKYIFV